MIIGIAKEVLFNEKRVAITPDIVKKLTDKSINVLVEKNAGESAGFSDKDFIKSGAEIVNYAGKIYNDSSVLFKIWAPSKEELVRNKYIPCVIGDFSRFTEQKTTFRAFALEKMPRISRAQNMDILSSQNNLNGYKAAIVAINNINRSAPMMITAAGTLIPLKILIWGLGVAGLQAAATLKRIGAKVYASDIREETKEQALSVGAVFIGSENILAELSGFDIIITSAGNYGNAPNLIDKKVYSHISSSTVIIDISGNVDDKISSSKIIRNYNFCSDLSHSASTLFANNLYNFFCYVYDFSKQEMNLNFNDDIINQTYIGERRNG